VKLIYIGNGAALIGIPARDLNEDDIAALLEGLTIDDLLASGLYKRTGENVKSYTIETGDSEQAQTAPQTQEEINEAIKEYKKPAPKKKAGKESE